MVFVDIFDKKRCIVLQKKINLREIKIFLIIIPYLKPYNITLISSIDNVFKIWKIISTIIIVLIFLARKKKKIDTRNINLFIFCIVWTLSLLINKAPFVDYFNNILSIVGITLYISNENYKETFKENFSHVLYKISAMYMIFNFVSAIIGTPFFAREMELADNANFLGGDNYSAFILIVLCGLMFFYDIHYNNRFRFKTWMYALAGLMSLIIPFSFSGMISYILLLFLICLKNNPFIRKIVSWKTIVVFCVIAVVSIGYLNLDRALDGILTELDKSGFNGRNFVWECAVRAIAKQPLIGYGGVSDELASTWILAGMNHTHNFVLQYFFSVGVIGSMFFILYFVKTMRDICKKADSSLNVLYYTIICFLLCAIFDFYIGLIYFYLLLEVARLFKKSERLCIK